MIKDPKNITMKVGDTGYLVVDGKIEQINLEQKERKLLLDLQNKYNT